MAMKIRYLPRNILTLALFPLCASAASPWSVNDGSTLQVTGGYNSSEKNDFPLDASGAGSTLVTDPGLTFTTVDVGTFAARLREGASLELNDATLSTAGGSAHGIDMTNATLTVNQGTFKVAGNNSAAIMAGNSNLELNHVSMQLSGNVSQGIRLSDGSLKVSELKVNATGKTNRVISLFNVTGTLDNVDITQQDAGSDNAIFLSSSTLTASNVTINAATNTRAAIKVGNGVGDKTRSSLTLKDSTITTGYVGLRAMNGDMTLTDVNVHTTGAYGHALDINSQSDTVIEGGSYLTDGMGAAGASQSGATTTLSANNARFTTSGDIAHAIQVQAGTAALTNSILTTSGNISHGIYTGSNVTGSQLAISTSGGQSYGVFAASGGKLTLSDSTITTTGITGYGVAARNGTITVTDTQIETFASDARGIYIRETSLLDLKKCHDYHLRKSCARSL